MHIPKIPKNKRQTSFKSQTGLLYTFRSEWEILFLPQDTRAGLGSFPFTLLCLSFFFSLLILSNSCRLAFLDSVKTPSGSQCGWAHVRIHADKTKNEALCCCVNQLILLLQAYQTEPKGFQQEIGELLPFLYPLWIHPGKELTGDTYPCGAIVLWLGFITGNQATKQTRSNEFDCRSSKPST